MCSREGAYAAVVVHGIEHDALIAKPVDVLSRSFNVIAPQKRVAVVVRVGQLLIHHLVAIRQIEARFMLHSGSQTEYDLGGERGAAELARLLDQNDVEPRFGCFDGSAHTRVSSADDSDVG